MEQRHVLYVGNGTGLADIPARDLTLEETEAAGGVDALIATGLYAATPAAPAPSVADPVPPSEVDAAQALLNQQPPQE